MSSITDQINAEINAVKNNPKILAKHGDYEFTYADLEMAFDLVSPKPNWKEKIDILIYLTGDANKQIAAIREAVKYFCDCEVAIDYTEDSTQTRPRISVMGCGYYISVGA